MTIQVDGVTANATTLAEIKSDLGLTNFADTLQEAITRISNVRLMPRFFGKLMAYKAGAGPLPLVHIEGDSIGDGAGSSSGVTKPSYKLFVVDQTFSLLPGRVGESCSLPNIYAPSSGATGSITTLRYAVPGATSGNALTRLAAHTYVKDAAYSQTDILSEPNGLHDADLVTLTFANNDFTNPTWPRMLWFLEDSIRACLRRGQDVLIHVPHDRATGTAGSRTLDRTTLAQAQDALMALAANYSLPVLNMRDKVRQLVDTGTETVEDLFPVGDNVHSTDLCLEYEVAEFLSLLPAADSSGWQLAPAGERLTLPPRLYRQSGFFQQVNRWKNLFEVEGATVAGVALTTPFAPTTAWTNTSYTSTRAMLGQTDSYWLLSQSGDKATFRALGNRVCVGFVKQAVAGSAGIYYNGTLLDTVTFSAESEKDYTYYTSHAAGLQAQRAIGTIEIRWISGSIGVSHLCVGAARDAHHIATHPSDLVTLTGTWSDSGTFKRTTTQNDYIEIKFVGTAFVADMPLGPDYADFTVTVDGAAHGSVVTGYSVGTAPTRNVVLANGLTYGFHTIRITNATKNASSTGYKMDIRNYRAQDDRLDVNDYSVLTTSGNTLYVPEDNGGAITTTALADDGAIASTALLQYRTTLR
jgi:hypothetical protein